MTNNHSRTGGDVGISLADLKSGWTTEPVRPSGMDGLPYGLHVALHDVRKNLPNGITDSVSVTAITRDREVLDMLRTVHGGTSYTECAVSWHANDISFTVVLLEEAGAGND